MNAATVVYNISHWTRTRVGEINPSSSCGTFKDSNRNYVLYGGDITLDPMIGVSCIEIVGSNVTLDGNGSKVIGSGASGGIGISVVGDNVTIKNITVLNFDSGVYTGGRLGMVYNTSLIYSNITNSSSVGFYIGGSGAKASNNFFGSNVIGLQVLFSNFNFTGNTLVNNNYGMDIDTDGTANGNVLNSYFEMNNYSLYIDSTDYLNVSGVVVNNSLSNSISIVAPSRKVSKGIVLSNISVYNTSPNYYDLYIFGLYPGDLQQGLWSDVLIRDYNIGNYSFDGNRNYTLIFENSQFGKVVFLRDVNGTGNNLTRDVEFKNNSIRVRKELNPGLSNSANVTLYGIGNRGFVQPRIVALDIGFYWLVTNYTAFNAENVMFYTASWSEFSALGVAEGKISAPSISIVYPANNSNHSVNTVNVNYTVSDSALQACWYRNDSMSYNYSLASCVNITTVVWSEGQHNVTIWANDSVGNTNRSSVRFYVDSIATSVRIGKNASQVEFGYGGIRINWSASDSGLGVGSVSFNVTAPDGSLVNSSTSAAGEVNLSTGLTQIGTYTVNLRANDTLGNVNSTSDTFLVNDTIAPTFSNLANQTINDTDALGYDIDATDVSGISCFTVNDTTNFAINCSGYLRNATRLNVGFYWINITVNDTVNNRNSGVIYVNVSAADNQAPLLSYGVGTENDNEISSGSIYVNVSASDVNENKVVFSLYNSSGVVNSSVLSIGTRTINFTGLSAGTYRYNVTVNDTYGNSNSTATRTIVLVDNCLNANCVENNGCSINANCTLNNNLCTGGACKFVNMSVSAGVWIYTLYDSSGNGRGLTLNITDTSNLTRAPLSFGSNSRVIFSGKNGTSLTGGSAGGSAGNLTIYVYDLLNTTNARFIGVGGSSTSAGAVGGNGGNVGLYYHGLVRNFTDVDFDEENDNRPVISGGKNTTNAHASSGRMTYNKDSRCNKDADATGDGLVDYSDVTAVRTNYNLAVTNDARDVYCDNRLNVIDLAGIGFEYWRGY